MDGVDGIFVDPVGLAVSMSYRGNVSHPEVQVAIDNITYTIITSGEAAGTSTSDPVLVCYYLELGCTFVVTGIDILLLTNGARKSTRDFIAP